MQFSYVPDSAWLYETKAMSTNLLQFISIIRNALKNNYQTDVIFTDFSKAFDSVNHQLLLKKLNLTGFPITLIKWISTYLSNRSQRVSFKSSISNLVHVNTRGVPLGSHLGLLLFGGFIILK